MRPPPPAGLHLGRRRQRRWARGDLPRPDEVQDDTWRAAAHYTPELRLIGAEPAFDLGSYHLGEAARGLLALRARPEDDALVAPLRHPPVTPVRAPTPEALCAPWQRAWAGSQERPVEELPDLAQRVLSVGRYPSPA